MNPQTTAAQYVEVLRADGSRIIQSATFTRAEDDRILSSRTSLFFAETEAPGEVSYIPAPKGQNLTSAIRDSSPLENSPLLREVAARTTAAAPHQQQVATPRYSDALVQGTLSAEMERSPLLHEVARRNPIRPAAGQHTENGRMF